MAAVVQVSTRGEIENVQIIGAVTDIRLDLIGNGSMARRVEALTGENFGIVVSGNSVHVTDCVSGNGAGDSCFEVTGQQAILTGIKTANSGTASGVRVSGADCVINGFTRDADDTGLGTRPVLPGGRLEDVNITDSDNEGMLVTNSDHGVFEGVVYNTGRHGISISGARYNRFSGQVIDAGKDTANTYDGCIVAGDSNFNRTAFHIDYLGAGNQARYGLNISAATVDGHIEASYIDAGATADFNDAGTGTVLTDDHIV